MKPVFYTRLICCYVLVLGLATAASAQTRDDTHALLERAYSAISTGSPDALGLFEEIVRREPNHIAARRQLGLLYISAGRSEDALAQLRGAQSIAYSDTIELQIAYLLDGLTRKEEALTTFSSLGKSADSAIRERSRIATSVLSSYLRVSGYPWWGKSYSASYYETRFANTVLAGNVWAGYYLTENRTVSAIGTISVTHDTRSTGGNVPIIFSDNYGLAGGGIRLKQVPGLIADLQAGVAYDLLSIQTKKRIKGDFRGIISYGAGMYADLASPEKFTIPMKPSADLYISAGYYSRYENTIGYGIVRAGVRAVEWYDAALDVYLRANAVADSRREFYNNIAEGGIGVRLIPYHPIGISIMTEFHHGFYWDTGSLGVPKERSFNTFRLYFIIDHSFRL